MGKMGRGDYSLGDVIRIMDDESVAEKVEVARYYPALVVWLQINREKVLLKFAGDKKAYSADRAAKEALGLKEDDEPEKPEAPAAPAAAAPAKPKGADAKPDPDAPPGDTPDLTPQKGKGKGKDKPQAEAKPESKGDKKKTDENDLDALLNELEDADPPAEAEAEPAEED